jgi:hypothetical protein
MCQRTKERAATPKLQADPATEARTQTYQSLVCRSATWLETKLCVVWPRQNLIQGGWAEKYGGLTIPFGQKKA